MGLIPVFLFNPQGPVVQVSSDAQEFDLRAFEFEGDVLQGDESFAGLRAGVVEIMQVGRRSVPCGVLDGFPIFSMLRISYSSSATSRAACIWVTDRRRRRVSSGNLIAHVASACFLL